MDGIHITIGDLTLVKKDTDRTLIQEWNEIPQAEINTLIRSMRQRCQAALHAEGGHSLYLFGEPHLPHFNYHFTTFG